MIGAGVTLIVLTPLNEGARASEQETEPWKILIVGDSLATGRGISREAAYPAQLQAYAEADGWTVQVDTIAENGWETADGVSAIHQFGVGTPDIVILALGGNDGLRAVNPEGTRRNLEQMVDSWQGQQVTVILTGMEAPPEHGQQYVASFRAAFQSVAQSRRVAFVPFLLEHVARVPEMNQADGIHANEAGAIQIAYNLWVTLQATMLQMAAR